MRFSYVLLGAAAAVGVLANPTPHHDLIVHERRDTIPHAWVEESRLHRKTLLPMRIGLRQSNLDLGHDMLMKRSHPSSAQYGQHLSMEEVHDLFAPAQESVENVRLWLESAGIAAHRISQSTNKQWIQFDAAAEEVGRLLGTEYHVYSHAETGKSHIACREYHVPRSVQNDIDYITPGIISREVQGVERKSSLAKRGNYILPPILEPLEMTLAELLSDLLLVCDVAVTPSCIKAMYNITDGTTATKGNELGIFEGTGDVYSQEDLNSFFAIFASNIPQGTHPTLQAIDGAEAPTNVTNAGPESDLDFQISYPIIWPQNSILFQTDDMVYENNNTLPGFLNTFLDAIDGSYCSEISDLDPSYPDPAAGGYKGQLQCGVFNPTNVISISYGGAEADLPISYQRRQCNEWMKLGLQGVSVVVASGDSGVEGRDSDPTPSECLGTDGKVFAPDFPATCPYLTTVGGTYLPAGADPRKDQEVAVTSFASGGGFSNIYQRPDYQNTSVENYFSISNPPYKYYESVDNSSFAQNGGIYNRIGRAYPDLAAIADKVVMFNQGLPTLVGGTSAAAPVFASILTRINEERLAANKSTVGFVNPVLYAHPEMFNDITQGTNPGCGTNGFSAAQGWDPVTGLGTPNYPELLRVFMNQP